MITELQSYINSLAIIDTHEHLPIKEALRPRHDVLAEYLIHYFSVDLVSGGMPPQTLAALRADDIDIKDKWALAEPYWEAARYTGYGRALSIAARDIYGIDDINASTIAALNDAYLRSYGEEHYERVLKGMSKIEISILDSGNMADADPKYFKIANRIDSMLYPRYGYDITALESESGVRISSFDDYLRACEKQLLRFSGASNILKCGTAYLRSLDFPRTTRAKAEEGFNRLFEAGYNINADKKTYQADDDFSNYVFRYLIGLARKNSMIVQIHTGIQEGNGNLLSNSDPANLNKIFLEYPDVEFDLFHIGYPYQDKLGALCKTFPNVYIDMCWAHIVSPIAAQRALGEWLESIPYTKINGFGGDYCLVDGVYGHQYIARENISKVLSEKVEQGLFTLEKACRIGKALLYDNPKRIFRL